MCIVSFIGDHYRDKYRDWYPEIIPAMNAITRDEFDALKRDVEEMKKLLKRAKKYDEDTGQPDCEVDDKMEFLRKLADVVGISLDDVIGAKNKKQIARRAPARRASKPKPT